MKRQVAVTLLFSQLLPFHALAQSRPELNHVVNASPATPARGELGPRIITSRDPDETRYVQVYYNPDKTVTLNYCDGSKENWERYTRPLECDRLSNLWKDSHDQIMQTAKETVGTAQCCMIGNRSITRARFEYMISKSGRDFNMSLARNAATAGGVVVATYFLPEILGFMATKVPFLAAAAPAAAATTATAGAATTAEAAGGLAGLAKLVTGAGASRAIFAGVSTYVTGLPARINDDYFDENSLWQMRQRTRRYLNKDVIFSCKPTVKFDEQINTLAMQISDIVRRY